YSEEQKQEKGATSKKRGAGGSLARNRELRLCLDVLPNYPGHTTIGTNVICSAPNASPNLPGQTQHQPGDNRHTPPKLSPVQFLAQPDRRDQNPKDCLRENRQRRQIHRALADDNEPHAIADKST